MPWEPVLSGPLLPLALFCSSWRAFLSALWRVLALAWGAGRGAATSKKGKIKKKGTEQCTADVLEKEYARGRCRCWAVALTGLLLGLEGLVVVVLVDLLLLGLLVVDRLSAVCRDAGFWLVGWRWCGRGSVGLTRTSHSGRHVGGGDLVLFLLGLGGELGCGGETEERREGGGQKERRRGSGLVRA